METIQQRRESFDKLGGIYPKNESVNVQQEFINSVNCYWLTPAKPASNKIIIHLHGGVYAIGSINSHGSMLSHIANQLQAKILFVDYSLAPEKPFPAAINDVMNVYREIISTYPGVEINFIGDSAGAGLIISAVYEMLSEEIQLPTAVAMISPWISLSCDKTSYETNKGIDPILSQNYLKGSAVDYAGDIEMEIVNTENLKFSVFPPVLIIAGTNEILLDDSINFYNYIKHIQPQSTLTIYDNQNHVWPLANIHSEASKQALSEIESFLTFSTDLV